MKTLGVHILIIAFLIILGGSPARAAAGHIYTLEDAGCGGDYSTDNALFNINGTELRTSSVFDWETRNSYTICIRTTDTGAASFDKEYTITVNDNADIIINEVDSDTPGADTLEFIELYAGTAAASPLDGTVVVFFDGTTDLSYQAFDLDGYTTDSAGYFVIGNAGVPGVDLIFADGLLQNGADAVALYAADATSFPTGTAVTANNLLDALVYDTGQADDGGLLTLLVGGGRVNEARYADVENDSIQRRPSGAGGKRNTTNFDAFEPTPKAVNTNTVPAVSSIVRANSNPTNAASVSFTVTFSETVSGVDSLDFSITTTGSAAGTVTSVTGSGNTRTVTVNSITGEGSLRLDLSDYDTITDGVDPLGGTGVQDYTAGESYTIDNTVPGLTSFVRQTPATSPTNADTLVFRGTFDEGVQNIHAADFTVTGTTAIITDVHSINASTYDLIVTGGDLASLDASVGIDLAAGQDITDLAGNGLPTADPGTDETYTVDNTAPGIISFARQTPATNPTNADTLVLRATFDENVQNVNAPDFTISGTSTAAITNVAVMSSNTVYDITLSGGDLAGFNGTVGINLAGGQDITDLAGNALPPGEPGPDQTYTLDNTAPSAPSAPTTPDMTPATDTGTSNSDNNTSNTTPVFTGTATPNSSITLISSLDGDVGTASADGSGNWAITASTLASGAHSITATATDAVGNTSAASSALAINIDIDAPVISGTPADIVTNTDPGMNTATVSWSEPTANDVQDGPVTPVQTGGLANGSLFPVGLTTITYTATDSAGNNSVESFTVTVIDNEPPVLSGVPTDMTVSTLNSGSTTSTASWTEPTATDAVDGIVTPVQTAGAGNGGDFPIGSTLVTYTATDAQGNSSSASFTVTVVQREFPWLEFLPGLVSPNKISDEGL